MSHGLADKVKCILMLFGKWNLSKKYQQSFRNSSRENQNYICEIKLLVLLFMNTKIPYNDRKFNFDTITHKNFENRNKNTKDMLISGKKCLALIKAE